MCVGVLYQQPPRLLEEPRSTRLSAARIPVWHATGCVGLLGGSSHRHFPFVIAHFQSTTGSAKKNPCVYKSTYCNRANIRNKSHSFGQCGARAKSSVLSCTLFLSTFCIRNASAAEATLPDIKCVSDFSKHRRGLCASWLFTLHHLHSAINH